MLQQDTLEMSPEFRKDIMVTLNDGVDIKIENKDEDLPNNDDSLKLESPLPCHSNNYIFKKEPSNESRSEKHENDIVDEATADESLDSFQPSAYHCDIKRVLIENNLDSAKSETFENWLNHESDENISFITEPECILSDNLPGKYFDDDEIKGPNKKFTCAVCSLGFTRRIYLVKHLNKRHSINYNLSCHQCNYIFMDIESLRQHVEYFHINVTKYCCDQCNRDFGRIDILQRHMDSVHKGNKGVMCGLCYRSFAGNKELKKHTDNVHNQIRNYPCTDCNRAFSSKYSLQSHINSVHKQIRRFVCPECSCPFSRKGDLTKHFESIHNFRCLMCDLYFEEKESLKLHNYEIHRNFSCCECCNRYSTKSHLKKHIAAVHAVKNPDQPVKINPRKKSTLCTICNRNFTKLKKHVDSVHNKIKDFNCDECPRAFSNKYALQTHVDAVHKQIKKFACSKCGLPFSRKADLIKHTESIHNFKCLICNKSFEEKITLKRHNYTNHRNFLCAECPRCFSRKTNLRNHIVKHHKIKKPTLKNRLVNINKNNISKIITDPLEKSHCEKLLSEN